MAEPLALKWRPHKFEDIASQKPVWYVLRKMVQTGNVPTALLFAGSQGCGKTSTARILAAALNCEDKDSPPCGKCASCRAVQEGTALSVMEIDAASNGLVADIRKLRETLLYDHGGKYRVVLLDEAHSMSRDAFNALLTVLEEPPPRTIFVLLTTESRKILATVASRCMPFWFGRIPVPEIIARLSRICQAEWPGEMIDSQLLADIAERAEGGMRDAIVMLDQARSVGISTLVQYQQMTGDSDFGPLIVNAMADGNPAVLFGHVDKLLCDLGDYGLISSRVVSCLRDVLVLHAGGTVSAQGASLAARQALAARLDPYRVTAALQVLWDLRTKIRVGTDLRSSLDLAMVVCMEKLKLKVTPNGHNGHVTPNGHNGNGHKATVAELQKMTAGV